MRYLILALLLAPLLAVAAEDEAWGVQQLMHDLASVQAAESTFVERKTIGYLRQPLVVSGTLAYRAPDRLVKHVQNPIDERFVAEGERVSVERNANDRRVTRSLGLDDHPLLRPLIVGLRATLAGDLAALERFYAIELSGDPGAWELRLAPRADGLREILEEVRIRGRDAALVSVEVLEPNGDRAAMTISPR